MNGSQAAIRRTPSLPAPAGAARAALRARLGELVAMLAATPVEDRAALRERVREAQLALRTGNVDDALLALLLRNLLVDLAQRSGRFDAGYFAGQIARRADALG